jgi:uncharacterized protein YqhQ
MCRQFGQTCADEQENTRTLLQIYEGRNNHLANLISASNGLIVIILVGVLAFAGSVQNLGTNLFYLALIVAVIVLSLISWRWNAHLVDRQIIEVYGKILCCEYKLNVDTRTSLILSLVNGFSDKNKKSELLDLIKSKQVTRAYNEMFFLIEEKRVGDRGHRRIDRVAALLCFLSLAIGGMIAFSVLQFIGNAIIILIFGLLAGCLITLVLLYRYLPIAKNPE